MRKLAIAIAAMAVAGAGLAGCDKEAPADGATDGKIAVTATDTECKVGRTDVKAGTVTFTVTNKGAKVTEFYLLASGDRVLGEVENIAPGLSRELIVEVPAGTFRDVVVVESKYWDDSVSTERPLMRYEDYYARGVGLLRTVTFDEQNDGKQVVEQNLLRYAFPDAGSAPSGVAPASAS